MNDTPTPAAGEQIAARTTDTETVTETATAPDATAPDIAAPDATAPAAVTPMRLGFARGIAPSKWANRWAVAVPDVPLELVPLTVAGRVPPGEAPVDVTLVRLQPERTLIDAEGPGATVHAMHVYTEAIALVVAADHELAELESVDAEALQLATLLAYPGHAPQWPTPQAWEDPSWAPKHTPAALELVATGIGGILMPLPLARHLTRKRTHAVIPLTIDPPLPGTEIWATWDIARDAGDVQQLVGIMRGRTARSQRLGANAPEPTAKEKVQSAKAKRHAEAMARQQKQAKKIAQMPKNSRGAQLAAAAAKREQAKRAKQQKRKGR